MSSALIQKVRIRLLDACGTSRGWRRRASRIGLLKEAKNITYDRVHSCWMKERLYE